MAQEEFQPGDRVETSTIPGGSSLFDKRLGTVRRVDPVNVHVEIEGADGLWRFMPSELRKVPVSRPYPTKRVLSLGDTLYADTLQAAVEKKREQENYASQLEFGADLFHSVIGYAAHFNSGEWRVLVEFGQVGDTMVKAARVIKVNDFLFELEWV